MGLTLGRRKTDGAAPSAALNSALEHELLTAAHKSFTGVIEASDRSAHALARLHLYKGGLYSVHLQGYTPPILARLTSSGVLDEHRGDLLLASVGDDPLDVRVGPFVVEQGWMSVEALATVHQEYLLASLGAALLRPKVKVRREEGSTTSSYCTLPVPVAALLDVVRMRVQRLSATWATVTTDWEPGASVLYRTGTPVPSSLAVPEALALAAAVTDGRLLDDLAHELGLTRAEAVHITALLFRAGVLTASSYPGRIDNDTLPVPEAFGVALAATTDAPPFAVPEPEPEPVPEPVLVLTPEALILDDRVGEPVREPALMMAAAMWATEPMLEHVPQPVAEPAPEPAIVVEPAIAPARAPAPVSRPDEHVRQLRVEFARAEVAELEETLAAAERAEVEVISRTAAVRERLRSARATLTSLEAGPADPTDPPGTS